MRSHWLLELEDWVDRNLQVVRLALFSLTAGSAVYLFSQNPLLWRVYRKPSDLPPTHFFRIHGTLASLEPSDGYFLARFTHRPLFRPVISNSALPVRLWGVKYVSNPKELKLPCKAWITVINTHKSHADAIVHVLPAEPSRWIKNLLWPKVNLNCKLIRQGCGKFQLESRDVDPRQKLHLKQFKKLFAASQSSQKVAST